jgi:excisionase family DNA binding protein
MQLLISIPDAAQRLGIGKTLTYELLKLEKLKAVRLGGRTLIPVVELERFVAALPQRDGRQTLSLPEIATEAADDQR